MHFHPYLKFTNKNVYMKKNIIYIALLAVGFLMGSCENNFDPKIYGSLNSTNFPKTESDFENYLIECYAPFSINWGYSFPGGSWQENFYVPEGGVFRLLDATTDYCAPWAINTWGGSWLKLTSGQFADMKYYGRSSGGDPSHFEKVRDITRFTKVIGDIDASTTISDASKKQFLGEAKLLRGLMMYYLMHFYGPVPVVLDPAQASDTTALSNLVRPTLDQMTQYITTDLEYAASNMKETQAAKGRYTADYARFMLMKHYLNEGAHMAGYYQKAQDMKAKFTGSYSLFGASGSDPDAYANQFKIANKFNSEVIMSVSCSSTADGSGTKGNFNPLSWYVVPNDAAKTTVWGGGVATPFVNQGGGWGQCFNVDPKYYSTYESGDNRAKVVLTSYLNWSYVNITASDIGTKWSGFILNKYPIETATAFQGTDVPLARWADVLLMYAEAIVRNGSGAPTQEAIDMVNLVRTRAGLANLPGTATASKAAFLTALLAERGHEFLYEGSRKIDLIRFNVYRKTMTAYGRTPSSQYFPIPQYAVDQAAASGKVLTQTFERPDYGSDN